MNTKDFRQDFLDLVGELGNITFGSASTTLNLLLDERVNISTPKAEIIPKEKLISELPKCYVLTEVQYKEGLEGHNILLLKPNDAAIISDLMMGGNGKTENEQLSELELSAIQEAMNQMMGSAATSMSEFLNKDIDIKPPNITYIHSESHNEITNLFPEESVVRVSFELTIGNLIQSELMQVLNITFAKQLASELLGI